MSFFVGPTRRWIRFEWKMFPFPFPPKITFKTLFYQTLLFFDSPLLGYSLKAAAFGEAFPLIQGRWKFLPEPKRSIFSFRGGPLS